MILLPDALAGGVLVLDGGLSTELEARGHDLSSALWSARLLADGPDEIVAVHRSFLAAGAQVITTASYQASIEGFARAGFAPGEAERLIQRSVSLARRALDDTGATAWIAGSAGPYGAMLADGSEYTGSYPAGIGVQELRAFHRPQLELLRDAGADVLACETIPSRAEAEAFVEELRALDHPGWLSLTTVLAPDGSVRTRTGELAAEAFALAAGVDHVVAVGVNCTSPDGVLAAVEVAAAASDKPVVVYPNSGEGWDADARTWIGTPASDASSADAPDDVASDAGPSEAGAIAGAAFTAGQVQSWRESGARLIGGCCRVGPAQIQALSRMLITAAPV